MGQSRTAGTLLAMALLVGACATTGGTSETGGGEDDEAQRGQELQQLAQSVMTDSGHVSVKLDDGVCFVYGFVNSGIDEKRILSTLRAADGVTSVRNGIQREM